MRAAMEKGDLVQVGRLGHRMKGTVVYLGAEPAKEAAHCAWSDSRVTTAAARGQEAVNALEQECRALKAALNGHRLVAEPM